MSLGRDVSPKSTTGCLEAPVKFDCCGLILNVKRILPVHYGTGETCKTELELEICLI